MNHIRVGDIRVPVLVAISHDEQERGLSGQSDPPPAMIFPYSEPKFNGFWMRGCDFGLDLVFCLKGRVVSIQRGEPQSRVVLGSTVVSDLVVEFPAGFCAAQGITEGMSIDLDLDKDAKLRILSSWRF